MATSSKAVSKVSRTSGRNQAITPLQTISVREFAARFANGVTISQQSFTWFLGAGCSKTSGILDAAGLADKWLREQYELEGHAATDFESWAKSHFKSYDPKNLANAYAEAFARRYPSPVERQREIEMICARGEPAYGYATLAQLVSDREHGRRCNTILTTNFDDLIADALYLYGERNARPLVVTHEALARYVRTNSPRPTIVKLHGDAHIDPKNLQPETRQLDQSLRTQLYPFLQDHALIFIGYGGNDESILKFVRECPVPALAPAIYWVSEREAPSDFNKWLSERNAIRVDHTDFDQLMHLIRNALRLELIDRKRWTQIGDRYYEAFETLREKIEKLGAASEDTVALKIATSEAEATLPDDWHYVRRARRALGNNNPDDAEQILLEGLQAYPESRRLNFDYAEILAGVRKNFDQANIYYQRAVAADPKNELSLIGYADFLSKRNELDQAEIYYRRAVDTNPESARAATWYAGFLNNYRNDANAAEVQFKRAVELDPKFTFGLITYALFLKNAGDMDGAENYYQRAIETDPKYAFALSEYALFLQNVRGKMDEAEKYFKRAVEAEPNYKYGLSEYARFLAEVRMNIPEAELYFKRSIEADPTNEMLRTVYDQFLARKSDKSKVS